MGYLGRRIGLSQDSGDSNPGGADGAVGGGILDLFAQVDILRDKVTFIMLLEQPPQGITATGGVLVIILSVVLTFIEHMFLPHQELLR